MYATAYATRAVYPSRSAAPAKISAKFTVPQVLTYRKTRGSVLRQSTRGLHHHLPTTDRPARSCR